MPRAPLPPFGVTDWWETSHISSAGVTPPSSLILAHAPDRCPPHASGCPSCERSLQVAASPCRATALPDVISADLSLHVRTPIPAAPRVHAPVSSPRALAFPGKETGRRIATVQQLLLLGVLFRNCGHSLLFSPADLLALQIAPTLTSLPGSQGFYNHAEHGWLPAPCSGHANRPNPGNWR